MATTRWFQALLKAATGMLTAILGLLFLRAGVVPGFTQIDTQSQILVYAIVFGASQELITRFVDRRSNDLLAAVTVSEEAAGDRTHSDDES
jgi:membrane protein implicated in regulation of membrane protease activity